MRQLSPALAGPDPATFEELLAAGSRQRGLPWREARMLMAVVAGRSQEWLVAHGLDPAEPDVADRFLALAARRARGEPMAYLTGVREFYGRAFAVSPAVLIPRPETELLVEVALALLDGARAPRLLDMGTGSGVLAVTLALERPDATVLATDASRAALQVATGNAASLGAGRIGFHCGDWWQALDPQAGRFDLIVSNPPYIAADDPHLSQGDLRFEPRHALAAGPEGDADLRKIIAGAPERLVSGGWLAVEHGLEQGARCRHLMEQAGFADVFTHLDLEHRERVTVGRAPCSLQADDERCR